LHRYLFHMGISERREKEKKDLRKLILDAAMEIFLEKGFDELSIRTIAEKIEYSPTTIYLYFKDKDDILFGLHLEGFRLMNEKMSVLEYVSDPFDRLKAMGRIYLDFALENTGLYDLMFIREAPMKALECVEEDWHQGKIAFDGLKYVVKECIDAGYLNFKDTEAGAFLIWSAMHGMCALQIGNRCIGVISEDKRDTIVQLGYQSFIELLEFSRMKI